MAWDYQAEVAADTPYLWYRMNEAAGTTATDNGSNGEDGTYAGNALERVINNPPIIWGSDPGPQGRCPEFNVDAVAVDDGRIERAGLTLATLDEIAAEIWVEDPPGFPSLRYFFSYAVAGTPNEFALRNSNFSSQIELFINGTQQNISLISANNQISEGRAHHLYVDWRASDGRVRFFFDGIQHFEATGLETGNNLTSGGTLMIAQNQTAPGTPGAASAAWQGRMDQFALYDSALTAERIAIHASAGHVRYVDLLDHNMWPNGIEFFQTGGGAVTYINRVFDTVAGNFVSWTTSDPDPTGSSYPGPGTFGQDTSDYCVEARVAG